MTNLPPGVRHEDLPYDPVQRAQFLEKFAAEQRHQQALAEELDEFEALLADPELDILHKKRMNELKEQLDAREAMDKAPSAASHGEYTEVVEEEFLKEVTGSKLTVCHFYHNDFTKCKILDGHLEKIARKHQATRFIKLNVEKAPFFVEKLQVRVLPTTIFFEDGVAKHRMVGFEGLGFNEVFPTEALEKYMGKIGVIKYKGRKAIRKEKKRSIFASKEADYSDSDSYGSADDSD